MSFIKSSKLCVMVAVLATVVGSTVVFAAEKMVVVDKKGNLLDVKSDKVKQLVKEKGRVRQIKKRVLTEKLPPRVMVNEVYRPIAEANRDQFAQNVKHATKFKGMAEQAASRNQKETAQKYMAVAKLFHEYSQHNRSIYAAYTKGASSDIRLTCEEILKIEKEIQRVSGKRVPRDWITPQELQSVSVMTESAYNKMKSRTIDEPAPEKEPDEGE